MRYINHYINLDFMVLYRDTLIYATSVESRGMGEAVKILSEVILRPQLQAEEVSVHVFPFSVVLQHFHLQNDEY